MKHLVLCVFLLAGCSSEEQCESVDHRSTVRTYSLMYYGAFWDQREAKRCVVETEHQQKNRIYTRYVKINSDDFIKRARVPKEIIPDVKFYTKEELKKLAEPTDLIPKNATIYVDKEGTAWWRTVE